MAHVSANSRLRSRSAGAGVSGPSCAAASTPARSVSADSTRIESGTGVKKVHSNLQRCCAKI